MAKGQKRSGREPRKPKKTPPKTEPVHSVLRNSLNLRPGK